MELYIKNVTDITYCPNLSLTFLSLGLITKSATFQKCQGLNSQTLIGSKNDGRYNLCRPSDSINYLLI